MNERLARRKPIDLEELDRQLRSPYPVVSKEGQDPLAELARLVNSSPDPFAPIFAKGRDGAPKPHSPQDRADPAALRPGFDDGAGPWQPKAAPAAAVAPAQDDVDLASYGAAAAQHVPAPGRHRMVLASLGAISAVVAVSATLALRNHAVHFGGPPTILADAAPYKVPGPVQTKPNSAATTKSADSVQSARLVNTEEQPVDLSLAASNRDQAGGSPAPGAASSTFFPPPRAVRTVSVRPDGTIIGAESAAAGDAGSSAAASRLPTDAAESGDASPSTTPADSRAASPAAAAPGGARQPSFANIVDQAAHDAAPAPATRAPAAPVRAARPAASLRTADIAPAAPAPSPSAADSANSWAVQLAAPGSAREAAAASSRLAHKYAGQLGGRGLVSRQAESNGREIWRVRVAGLSRPEAIDICTRIKGAGGACFLAHE
jgi:hypothetical protein